MTADDPVTGAIARATAGLSDADTREVADRIRQGLADIDPVVEPDDLAIEVDAALDVPPGDRVAAARRFAAHRRAFSLSRRSWALLEAFTAGDLADPWSDAAALLADVEDAIGATADRDIRYQLADYALEARYVLSGGAGPISLRGVKLTG